MQIKYIFGLNKRNFTYLYMVKNLTQTWPEFLTLRANRSHLDPIWDSEGQTQAEIEFNPAKLGSNCELMWVKQASSLINWIRLWNLWDEPDPIQPVFLSWRPQLNQKSGYLCSLSTNLNFNKLLPLIVLLFQLWVHLDF